MNRFQHALRLGLAITALWTVASSTVFAHPGHAIEVVDPQSPVHYLLQPEHGLPLLALATVIGWFFVRSLRSRSLRSRSVTA